MGRLRKIWIAAAMASLLFALHTPARALTADTLTVTVGYFGGPYYEKAVFTADELWAMNVAYTDYTFIDNMPSVVIDHVAGVTLSDLMDAAGIDLGSVQSFNFWTNDKEGGYYNSFTKRFLIDTPRYCYYSLPDNFDYDYGAGNEYATADGARVPTMIALADDWNRALAGASFGSDYLNLNTDTRFRLVYGQTDAVTHTASDSAKWIHRIEVTLGGAPTLTFNEVNFDLEIGSKLRTEPRVSAADPVIAENIQIEWRSSDETIATVDETGEITVHAEGAATISALINGAEAGTVSVSGKPGTAIDNGQGTVENEDEDEDAGDGEIQSNPSPQATPQPSAVNDQLSTDAVLGREITVVASQSDNGGVQNWRGDEMPDSAEELPIIPEKVAATYFLIAVAIFLVGGVWEYAKFRRSRHA
jgi:hypothetical protein